MLFNYENMNQDKNNVLFHPEIQLKNCRTCEGKKKTKIRKKNKNGISPYHSVELQDGLRASLAERTLAHCLVRFQDKSEMLCAVAIHHPPFRE